MASWLPVTAAVRLMQPSHTDVRVCVCVFACVRQDLSSHKAPDSVIYGQSRAERWNFPKISLSKQAATQGPSQHAGMHKQCEQCGAV